MVEREPQIQTRRRRPRVSSLFFLSLCIVDDDQDRWCEAHRHEEERVTWLELYVGTVTPIVLILRGYEQTCFTAKNSNDLEQIRSKWAAPLCRRLLKMASKRNGNLNRNKTKRIEREVSERLLFVSVAFILTEYYGRHYYFYKELVTATIT